LLAFGVRFDDRVTGKVSEFAKHGKIVHIDIDPSEINKIKTATLPICGDIGVALSDLVAMIDEDAKRIPPVSQFSGWMEQVDKWRDEEPLKFNDRDDAIISQFAIQRLYEIVRE